MPSVAGKGEGFTFRSLPREGNYLHGSAGAVIPDVDVYVAVKNARTLKATVGSITVVMTIRIFYNSDSERFKVEGYGHPSRNMVCNEYQHVEDFWNSRNDDMVSELKKMLGTNIPGTPEQVRDEVRRMVRDLIINYYKQTKANYDVEGKHHDPAPDDFPRKPYEPIP